MSCLTKFSRFKTLLRIFSKSFQASDALRSAESRQKCQCMTPSCGKGRRSLLIFHPLFSTEMPLFWSHQGCGLQDIEGCNLSPNDALSSSVASASFSCTGRRTTELLPSTIGRKSCKPQDFPIEISAAAAPKAAATL